MNKVMMNECRNLKRRKGMHQWCTSHSKMMIHTQRESPQKPKTIKEQGRYKHEIGMDKWKR